MVMHHIRCVNLSEVAPPPRYTYDCPCHLKRYASISTLVQVGIGNKLLKLRCDGKGWNNHSGFTICTLGRCVAHFPRTNFNWMIDHSQVFSTLRSFTLSRNYPLATFVFCVSIVPVAINLVSHYFSIESFHRWLLILRNRSCCAEK